MDPKNAAILDSRGDAISYSLESVNVTNKNAEDFFKAFHPHSSYKEVIGDFSEKLSSLNAHEELRSAQAKSIDIQSQLVAQKGFSQEIGVYNEIKNLAFGKSQIITEEKNSLLAKKKQISTLLESLDSQKNQLAEISAFLTNQDTQNANQEICVFSFYELIQKASDCVKSIESLKDQTSRTTPTVLLGDHLASEKADLEQTIRDCDAILFDLDSDDFQAKKEIERLSAQNRELQKSLQEDHDKEEFRCLSCGSEVSIEHIKEEILKNETLLVAITEKSSSNDTAEARLQASSLKTTFSAKKSHVEKSCSLFEQKIGELVELSNKISQHLAPLLKGSNHISRQDLYEDLVFILGQFNKTTDQNILDNEHKQIDNSSHLASKEKDIQALVLGLLGPEQVGSELEQNIQLANSRLDLVKKMASDQSALIDSLSELVHSQSTQKSEMESQKHWFLKTYEQFVAFYLSSDLESYLAISLESTVDEINLLTSSVSQVEADASALGAKKDQLKEEERIGTLRISRVLGQPYTEVGEVSLALDTYIASIANISIRLKELEESLAEKKIDLKSTLRSVDDRFKGLTPSSALELVSSLGHQISSCELDLDIAKKAQTLSICVQSIERSFSEIKRIQRSLLKEDRLLASRSVIKSLFSANGDARILAITNDVSVIVDQTNRLLESLDLDIPIAIDLQLEKDSDQSPVISMRFEVDGSNYSFNLPSESQRKIVGLCTDLSLSRVTELNLFKIIDEPESGLDDKNKSKITRLLKMLTDQVIVLTNEQASLSFIENVVSTSEINLSGSQLTPEGFSLLATKKVSTKKGARRKMDKKIKDISDQEYTKEVEEAALASTGQDDINEI